MGCRSVVIFIGPGHLSEMLVGMRSSPPPPLSWFSRSLLLLPISPALPRTAVDREGNNLNDFKDFRTENGSNQGQNLALLGIRSPGAQVVRALFRESAIE